MSRASPAISIAAMRGCASRPGAARSRRSIASVPPAPWRPSSARRSRKQSSTSHSSAKPSRSASRANAGRSSGGHSGRNITPSRLGHGQLTRVRGLPAPRRRRALPRTRCPRACASALRTSCSRARASAAAPAGARSGFPARPFDARSSSSSACSSVVHSQAGCVEAISGFGRERPPWASASRNSCPETWGSVCDSLMRRAFVSLARVPARRRRSCNCAISHARNAHAGDET